MNTGNTFPGGRLAYFIPYIAFDQHPFTVLYLETASLPLLISLRSDPGDDTQPIAILAQGPTAIVVFRSRKLQVLSPLITMILKLTARDSRGAQVHEDEVHAVPPFMYGQGAGLSRSDHAPRRRCLRRY